MEILIVLLIVVVIMTCVGHAIWLMLAAVINAFRETPEPHHSTNSILTWHCEHCDSNVAVNSSFCKCGTPKTSDRLKRALRNLDITQSEIVRLHGEGKFDLETLTIVSRVLREERVRLTSPQDSPVNTVTPEPEIERVVEHQYIPRQETISNPEPVVEEQREEPKPRVPRRSFSEVLNSFMEESNIRWGEIVGGLLIIGCSTALVVSLWSQISQIPVLKFLIFTTVTAVLFGIGLYTEHRWKLPTTSRGILTIATLLVPLNFLAIAAVSSGSTAGFLVLGSELLAPAIFLCLVYFAGRVITPGCAHLLAAGILGSSIGQLLVRHFGAPDASPELLVFLGAFPVVCYVIAVGLALRRVLSDRVIDATETSTVFTILGTMSFAALLPFGLLLYKSGPIGMTMMYLAPLVTLWGVPLLASGAVMWRRIQNVELVASRTAGTALGVLGLMIVIAGMILAWPNPASIVPTAILNFIIFTALAIALELPVAHLLASGCLALGYLVTFHVVTGHIRWQNLRVESLVDVSLQMSSGNALAAVFVLLLVASDWLRHKLHVRESFYYLIAACSIGIISLGTLTVFGPLGLDDKQTVWLFYLIFSLGGFWIAFRRQLTGFAWVGTALLLFSCASAFAWTSEYSFPWQTAFLFHSSVCTVAAILCSRANFSKSLCKALNYSSLISVVLAVLSLFQTNPYQVTSMQATRVFWIAGILLLALWLNRKHVLFVSLQVALTAAVILSVKGALQQYEWYTYLPHAFLHPVGLQIQGTFLALMCLCWIASRFMVQRFVSGDEHSLKGIRELFDTKLSVDRLIPWVLLGGFTLLSIYGAVSGIAREFALRGSDYPGWNIANFPHQEAFAIGSWIIMGLLAVIMLANAWERRRHVYLLGAVVAVAGVIPLLAARFEAQLATATAWRFLAIGFFLAGSVLLWSRERLSVQLKSFRWPSFSESSEDIALNLRVLLISLTVGPVVMFTLYPALRAMAHVPVQLPVSGVFSFFDTDFLFVVPLVVVALILIGYGIRERAPLYWFVAGLFFNFTVTLAHVLSVVVVNAPLDSVVIVRTVQLNAITFAVCSLCWLSFRSRSLALLGVRGDAADNLLKLQTLLVVLLNITLLLPFALEVFSGKGNQTIQAAGSLLGWLALSLSIAGFVLVKHSKGESFSAGSLATALMSIVCLITFGVANRSDAFDLRILTAGTTAVAWLMFVASFLPGSLKKVRLDENWSRHCLRLAPVIGSLAAFLGVRLLGPLARTDWWWSAMPLLALSALACALNYRTLRRRHNFAAGLLFSLAVWILFLRGQSIRSVMVLFEVSIMAACLFAALTVWLHNRSQRLSEQRWRLHRLSYHNVVVVGSVFILTVLTLVRFLFGSKLIHLIQDPELTWMAWLSIIALMFASLWDRKGTPTAGFYLLGLIGGAIGLQQLNLTGDNLAWAGLILLASYSIGVSLLWRKRSMLFVVADSLGIPFRIEPASTHMNWLSAATMLAVLSIGLTAFWINLAFLSLGFRVSAALALVAQTITLGLLAEGVSRERWRRASISALMIGVVLAGWSWLTPQVSATWLNRSVILMVLSFGLTAVLGLILRNLVKRHSKEVRWSTWANSIRACVPWLLSAGLVALLFCLCTEVFYQLSFGEVRIHPVSLVAIGVTLISGVIISILFALSPNIDPRLAGERTRMRLVYMAEVMLVLLFLHVRLAMPWLFTGFFEDYWPLVVMAIAYLGVVSSESLRRRDLLVLAKPFERTGVFLPLLPVLGFWFATSNVDYSSVLFVVGGLYGLLSILRRSFIFGALAAVAGNAGYWHLLQRTDDYGFVQHPQVWLIPAAASVLVAAYLNEDRLKEDEMASLRYLSLVTIYASSTADIFINGVENSPWLPLVLGALSLAGVFSGIMFRIRGLLLLGSVFLLLSITTMIWYASANLGWTWLWYVAGIATGATIIFMFAVFEKKRKEVLQVVEGLKDWEI